MERIEDLNLMVSEAKRMANAFKAFEKIPRVLSLLQSSTKILADLNKQETQKKADLDRIEVAADQAESKLLDIQAELEKAGNLLSDAKADVAEQKKTMLDTAKEEVAKKKASMEKSLVTALNKLDAEIEAKTEVVKGLEKDIQMLKNDHDNNLVKYKHVETAAQKRIADAEKHLEDIKKSLFGGN